MKNDKKCSKPVIICHYVGCNVMTYGECTNHYTCDICGNKHETKKELKRQRVLLEREELKKALKKSNYIICMYSDCQGKLEQIDWSNGEINFLCKICKRRFNLVRM